MGQKPEAVRFWSKVDKQPDGCWIWKARKLNYQGGFNKDGTTTQRNIVFAHHWSWESVHGPIPKHATIIHTCGNYLCVNPNHLELETDETRFWRKVEKTPDCWVWKGPVSGEYSNFTKDKGRYIVGHRYSWELLNSSIPPGFELHHRCNNKLCVNPAHLELTTKTNHIRNLSENGLAYSNLRKTHCKRGHPFNEENTYLIPGGKGRNCKICKSIQIQKYRKEPKSEQEIIDHTPRSKGEKKNEEKKEE